MKFELRITVEAETPEQAMVDAQAFTGMVFMRGSFFARVIENGSGGMDWTPEWTEENQKPTATAQATFTR